MFDQVGCGRSDKPANDTDYNYERHYKWMTDLCINHLDLKNVTAIFQVTLPLSKIILKNHPNMSSLQAWPRELLF